MSKQLPEVIDLDTQAMRLLSTFSDSMDFEAIRGKCGGEFLSITDTFMRAKDGLQKAPSAGTKDLKAFLTSFANIRNKIAQLERDGFALAAYEVRRALEHPDYRMLGEIHPFVGAVPVTLVMVHPEVTLQVIARKQLLSSRRLSIEDIPKGLNLPSYLKSHESISYYDIFDLLKKLNAPMQERLESQKPRASIGTCKHLIGSVILPNAPEEQDSKICSSFAYAFGVEKTKVLRLFKKEEQKQIAVWQFYLPKVHSDLHFGLHLAAEDNYWQNKRAPFCSVNVVHGYGAIAYPGEAYRCFDRRSKRFKGTRILLY